MYLYKVFDNKTRDVSDIVCKLCLHDMLEKEPRKPHEDIHTFGPEDTVFDACSHCGTKNNE